MIKVYRYSDASFPYTNLKYEYNKNTSDKRITRRNVLNRSDCSSVIDSLFDGMFKIAKAKENKDVDIWKISDDGKIIRKSDDVIVDKRSKE
jgi:protease II